MRTRTVLRDLPLLALLEQLYVWITTKIYARFDIIHQNLVQQEINYNLWYTEDLRRVKPETREDNGLCGDPEDCQGCGWCTEEKEIE